MIKVFPPTPIEVFERLNGKTEEFLFLKGYTLGLLSTLPEYVPSKPPVTKQTGRSKVVLDESTHEYAVWANGSYRRMKKNGFGVSVSGLLSTYVYKDSFGAIRNTASAAAAKRHTHVVATILKNGQSKFTEEELRKHFPATQEGVNRKWSSASGHGTRCHALCERWYRGELEFDSPEMTNPAVAHEMDLFRQFVQTTRVVGSAAAAEANPHGRDALFEAEASMVYVPLLLAGQADLILKVPGSENEVDLLDYKFTSKMDQSKTPTPEFKAAFPNFRLTKASNYQIQLMLYKALIEHHYPGVRVRNLKMINIDPSVCEEFGVRNKTEPEIIDVEFVPEIVQWILKRRMDDLATRIAHEPSSATAAAAATTKETSTDPTETETKTAPVESTPLDELDHLVNRVDDSERAAAAEERMAEELVRSAKRLRGSVGNEGCGE